MDRYTFVDKDGLYIDGANGKVWSDIRGRFYGKAIDRLAAYEDAEEQGKLVVPCRVGDTVYTNIAVSGWYLRSRNRPYSAKVVFIGINADDGMGGGLFNVAYDKGGYMAQFCFSDFGKTVFLTREEAEAALKQEVSNDT